MKNYFVNMIDMLTNFYIFFNMINFSQCLDLKAQFKKYKLIRANNTKFILFKKEFYQKLARVILFIVKMTC